MIRTVPLALAAALMSFAPLHAAEAPATTAAATPTVAARAGQPLYDGKGKRVVTVHRVMDDGAVQIIYDGRVITVPAATLSLVDGKLSTTLTRSELTRMR